MEGALIEDHLSLPGPQHLKAPAVPGKGPRGGEARRAVRPHGRVGRLLRCKALDQEGPAGGEAGG